MNIVCTICVDLFTPSDDLYSTPCGHIFHYHCLMQWFEKSNTCPQCRNKYRSREARRLYVSVNNDINSSTVDAGLLQNQNDDYILKISQKECEIKKLNKEIEELKTINVANGEKLSKLELSKHENKLTIKFLKEQIHILKNDINRIQGVEEELDSLKKEVAIMRTIEKIFKESAKRTDDVLNGITNLVDLRTLASSLKRELTASEKRRTDLKITVKNLQMDVRKEREKNENFMDKIRLLENQVFILEEENKNLMNDLKLAKIDLESQEKNTLDGSLILENKKRKYKELKGIENSPTVEEQVKKLEESVSPYLNLKSCPIGYQSYIKSMSKPFSNSRAVLGENSSQTRAFLHKKLFLKTTQHTEEMENKILNSNEIDLTVNFNNRSKSQLKPFDYSKFKLEKPSTSKNVIDL